MKVIKKVDIYSLVKKGRWYYIDNEFEVSEYFDKYEASNFFKCSDSEFIRKCKEMFD